MNKDLGPGLGTQERLCLVSAGQQEILKSFFFLAELDMVEIRVCAAVQSEDAEFWEDASCDRQVRSWSQTLTLMSKEAPLAGRVQAQEPDCQICRSARHKDAPPWILLSTNCVVSDRTLGFREPSLNSLSKLTGAPPLTVFVTCY